MIRNTVCLMLLLAICLCLCLSACQKADNNKSEVDNYGLDDGKQYTLRDVIIKWGNPDDIGPREEFSSKFSNGYNIIDYVVVLTYERISRRVYVDKKGRVVCISPVKKRQRELSE